MSGNTGYKAINWERRASDGTDVCSKCGKTVPMGFSIDVTPFGYDGDPKTFCTPCVTPAPKPAHEQQRMQMSQAFPQESSDNGRLFRSTTGTVYHEDGRGIVRRVGPKARRKP